ncbi:amidase domain-containing protein [Aquibacillus saliphilus]|uniref:amidase domain-containing protein n=1 Tax=Aquibacillus saliphilus TaxID=1909422 RepID=UPI001CF079B3|nr:amidase domain-containing protein [Aquibacillus saliphilus]
MNISEQIRVYWVNRLEEDRDSELPNWIGDKMLLHQQRGSKIARITGKGKIFRSYQSGAHERTVEYSLGVTFFVRNGDFFYHEEEERIHRALFYKERLISDEAVVKSSDEDSSLTIEPLGDEDVRETRFKYDRLAAVQYAERWWNDYNPGYKKFENDCTNYVSQCIHAGGATMRGAPNKTNGWWFENGNCSHSWAVAHSLRWYLSGSNQGLKGKELDSPKDLRPGDVICYDFQGDSKWDHNTIVVEKNSDGYPLVNAHTINSRHRFWSYEDSHAWTSACKYKFFRIGD